MTEFEKAFAAARKAGKKEFTWNGKRYHTRLKSETKKKDTPTPTPRPDRKTDTPRPTPRPKRKGEQKDTPRPTPRPTRLPKITVEGKKEEKKAKDKKRKRVVDTKSPLGKSKSPLGRSKSPLGKDTAPLSIGRRKNSKGGSSGLSIIDRIKRVFN